MQNTSKIFEALLALVEERSFLGQVDKVISELGMEISMIDDSHFLIQNYDSSIKCELVFVSTINITESSIFKF